MTAAPVIPVEPEGPGSERPQRLDGWSALPGRPPEAGNPLALLFWMLGDLRRARDAAYAVRARGIELGNTQKRLWGELVLCWVNTERGLLEEARTFLAPIDWSLPNDDLSPWTYAHLRLDLAEATCPEARAARSWDERVGQPTRFNAFRRPPLWIDGHRGLGFVDARCRRCSADYPMDRLARATPHESHWSRSTLATV
jgi:hypothetical protein